MQSVLLKKRKNTIILVTSVLLVMVIGFAAYQWNKPHSDIRRQEAIPITAMALYDTLAHGSEEITKIFNNKIVAVTGKVKRVDSNQQRQQIVLLETNRADAAINCTMEENVESLHTGEMITIQGICMGYANGDMAFDIPGDVFLIRCYRL